MDGMHDVARGGVHLARTRARAAGLCEDVRMQGR